MMFLLAFSDQSHKNGKDCFIKIRKIKLENMSLKG